MLSVAAGNEGSMAASPEVNSAKPVSSAFFRSPGRAATLATTVCILRTVWAACWPGVGGGGGGSPGGSGFGGGGSTASLSPRHQPLKPAPTSCALVDSRPAGSSLMLLPHGHARQL